MVFKLPKGYMNIGIATDMYGFQSIIADTNDGRNWDSIKIPLPSGEWIMRDLTESLLRVSLVEHDK
ncbi:MAG: hypothetical protein KAS32_00215 [Candidatus Peribacteraceae bacterium]|nr:hypothetical protein [Candidatus Peribacteraceae bacterium]